MKRILEIGFYQQLELFDVFGLNLFFIVCYSKVFFLGDEKCVENRVYSGGNLCKGFIEERMNDIKKYNFDFKMFLCYFLEEKNFGKKVGSEDDIWCKR